MTAKYYKSDYAILNSKSENATAATRTPNLEFILGTKFTEENNGPCAQRILPSKTHSPTGLFSPAVC